MTFTFDELYERFNKAIQWFVETGALINKSRIGEYEKPLSVLAVWTKQGILNQRISEENGAYYRSLLFEVMEIEEIYRGLQGLDSKDLLRRMEQIARGPIFLADESKTSNVARNYQFELLMASRLRAAGFDVFLTANNDLAIRWRKGVIPIECKRPQSVRQIEKRISTGCKQLRESYESLPINFRYPGILMFSIEKLNSNYQYIARSESPTGVLSLLRQKCNQFHEKYWRRVHAKGLGVGGLGVVLNSVSEVKRQLAYTGFTSQSYWADRTIAHEIMLRMSKLSQSTIDIS